MSINFSVCQFQLLVPTLSKSAGYHKHYDGNKILIFTHYLTFIVLFIDFQVYIYLVCCSLSRYCAGIVF